MKYLLFFIGIFGHFCIAFSQNQGNHSVNFQFGQNALEHNLVFGYLRSNSKHQLGIGIKYHLPLSSHDDSGNIIHDRAYARPNTLESFGLDLNYSRYLFCKQKYQIKFKPYFFFNSQLSKMSRLDRYYGGGSNFYIDSASGQIITIYTLYERVVPIPIFSITTAFGIGTYLPLWGPFDLELKTGIGILFIEEKGFLTSGRGWEWEFNLPFYQIGLRYKFQKKS